MSVGAVLALVPTAQASVTFGSDLTLAPAGPSGVVSCIPDSTAACTDVAVGFHAGNAYPAAAPIDGVITAVRYRSSTADEITLRLARFDGSGNLMGAGTGPTATVVASGNVEEIAVRVPVQAGDLLAGDGTTSTTYNCAQGGSYWLFQPPLVDGAPGRAPTLKLACELLVQAVIEADNDADGYGDESQDSDDDNDTRPDVADNCPLLANTDQADLDGDGKGDACDPDDDGDGVADPSDGCPTQAGTVSSGCPADNPPDGDGDGVSDSSDNCASVSNASQANLDGDGEGDACDGDDDNDDVPDSSDGCPTQANPTATGCPAPPGGTDTTDPEAAVSGKASQKLGETVALVVGCPNEPCMVTATGTLNVPGAGAARAAARFKLARVTSSMEQGAKTTLRLKLSKKARTAAARALRRGTKVTAQIRLTIRDAAGNTTVLKKTIKLKQRRSK